MYGDTTTVWQDIDLRVDPDPLCTPYHISTINQKARSETYLKAKTPLKWVFMCIIPATYSNILTKGNTFANYLLIVDA